MSWHDSGSPYAKYTGRCAGRILHFIYHYCSLHEAELVSVGYTSTDGSEAIKYGQEPFASYHWDDDVPVLNFFPEGWDKTTARYTPFPFNLRNDWTKAQELLRDKVAYPEEYRRSLGHELRRFTEKFNLLKHYTNGIDSDVRGLVMRYSKLIQSLPMRELDDYIRTAKLYEEISFDAPEKETQG